MRKRQRRSRSPVAGRFNEGRNHVAQHRGHRKESLRRRANVIQTNVVQQDLLNDEGGHCLRELGARLHDPQTERDDLRLQQKINDLRIIDLRVE